MPNETQDLFKKAIQERGVDIDETTSREEIFQKTAESQGFSKEEVAPFLELAKKTSPSAGFPTGFNPETGIPLSQSLSSGAGVLPTAVPITQKFGARNPAVEIFSGGVNFGTDFGVARGTPVTLPQGNWVVTEAFGGAIEGRRSVNRGYGNSVKVSNTLTGETLRFSHLSRVGVKPGQTLDGGQVIALTGSTGNSTGAHLDVEFTDETGRLRDFAKSKFAQGV